MLDIETKLQKAFDRLEKISIESENIKKQLIDKLSPEILALEFDFNNAKPRDIESKTTALNTFVSLVDSYEKNIRDTVKVSQKAQENETNETNAETIVELLKTIDLKNTNTAKVSDSVDDQIIDEKVKKLGIEISNGELETNNKIEGEHG